MAGDAAHVVNPVGGLGLTGGLLDAFSLGDALAAVIAGTHAESVLDAYAQERRRINRQQNNVSRSIYNDKHNAAQAHYGNNEVGQRRENQQDRIAQGIRSGQMNAGEASRTEGREQNISRSIAADRAANGGKLTAQERQNINHRQNSVSRQINRQKHNNKVAPK